MGIPLFMQKTSDRDMSRVLLRGKLSLPLLLPLLTRHSFKLVSLKALKAGGRRRDDKVIALTATAYNENSSATCLSVLHSVETNSDSLQF